jgi:hypothetical protein
MSLQAICLGTAPTVKELAEGTFLNICTPFIHTDSDMVYRNSPASQQEEIILFYGFVIPCGQLNDIVSKLYRELVDPMPGSVTNGFAMLYISKSLKDLCDAPYVTFETVRCSYGLPAEKMICIGDSLRPFYLETKALSMIAEKLGMRPNDAE